MTDLPDDWVTTTVGESASFLTGFPFASSGFSDKGIRLVRGSNVKRAVLDWTPDISRAWPMDEPALRAFHLHDGDIVIAMDGALVGRSYARVRKSDLPAYLVQRVARLRGRSVVQGVLYQWIASDRFVKYVDSVKTHTAIPHISPQDIRGFVITVPSDPEEQNRISDALADADVLISTLTQIIDKKRAIRQGMMQQLLTGRTRLRGFTAEWQDRLLGDYVGYVKTVPLSRAQLDWGSPARYLHYGDIHTRTSIRLDAAHEVLPRANSSLLGNAGRLEVGDLVFADASEDPEGVGKSVEITAVPQGGVVPGLHTIAARFDKTVLADGFKAYLQFIPSFRLALLRLAAGTKVLATTRSFISSITLRLPDVDEQRAIAAALGDADGEIERLQARLAKARDLKRGMVQELLTGRTRLAAVEKVG
jgi:type I restriction enzyme, S subunit